MSQRSKILTVLPPKVRAQLDKRLVEGAFADYEGLSRWLAEQGFIISRASLQRYGSRFEQRVQAVTLATQQASALAQASPDHNGAMADALTRLVQEKLFSVLVEADDIGDNQLARIARAVADLGRTTVQQKRWSEDARERLERQKSAAQSRLGDIEQRGGLTPEAADQIRAILLGIDPFASAPAPDPTRRAVAPLV